MLGDENKVIDYMEEKYSPHGSRAYDTDTVEALAELRKLREENAKLEDVVLQKNAAREVGEVKATERLAAEIKALCNTVESGLTAELAALKAEHARVCNDFALLVQESGREGRELDRMEGLLRAWVAARGDDESEASKDLWAEAVRLARTPA